MCLLLSTKEFLSFKFGRHEAGKKTGQIHARINMKKVGYAIYHSKVSMFLIAKHAERIPRLAPAWHRESTGFKNIFSITFYTFFFFSI